MVFHKSQCLDLYSSYSMSTILIKLLYIMMYTTLQTIKISSKQYSNCFFFFQGNGYNVFQKHCKYFTNPTSYLKHKFSNDNFNTKRTNWNLLEIMNPKKTYYFGNIIFLTKYQKNENLFLLGDFKVNLMNYNDHNESDPTNSFLDSPGSNSFL